MNKTFSSAANFRQALEVRLQKISKDSGVDLERVRRKVAFERFLARLFHQPPHPWVLKGGYSLEVRFQLARATKDLDLGTTLKISGSVQEQQKILQNELHQRAVHQLEDYFFFRVESPVKVIKSAPGGGFRFPIKSLVSGRLFVAFSLDVGIGDALTLPTEQMEGENWLGFCGVSPARFEAISVEQQLAEKIHALTLDRGGRENSRVKDLIDILLLIRADYKSKKVVEAVKNTFERQSKHPIPRLLPRLPENWRGSFEEIARECELEDDFDSAINILETWWNNLAVIEDPFTADAHPREHQVT